MVLHNNQYPESYKAITVNTLNKLKSDMASNGEANPDRRIGIDYIAIAGERRDEIARQLAAAIAIRSDDEIRSAPIQADSVDARMRAIYHLALTAPDARDETILHWFERYLADPQRDLRHAAVIGISYIGWPDFVPRLQALAPHDPDEIVRQDAATLIENLQEHPARSVVPH